MRKVSTRRPLRLGVVSAIVRANTTLALIGSGMSGGFIARLAVAAGLTVLVSNSLAPESLSALVDGLGPTAHAATVRDAAAMADFVVATTPMNEYRALPAAELAGKIVIDTMNYSPVRGNRIAELDSNELTSSELVQRHLAGSTVVKAFNTIAFHHILELARPADAGDRSGLPIAGDDVEAKYGVMLLLDTLGFDAVDLGPLAESWRSEPGTPVYLTPYMAELPKHLGPQEVEEWFLNSKGVPAPADTIRELADSTVRGGAGGHPGLTPDACC